MFQKSTIGRSVFGLMAILALAAFAPTAKASIVYSCVTNCNGNEYALEFENISGNTYQITLDVHVLSTYTGNQWTDLLKSVEIKDFTAGTVTNTSLVSAPGGLSLWNAAVTNELSNSGTTGCTGGANDNRLCVDAKSPSMGAGFTLGDVLSWTFQFDSTKGINDTTHIKYLYVDSVGTTKVGSLGSWDITTQTTFHEPTVPEPVTSGLVGMGLISLFFLRRRILG